MCITLNGAIKPGEFTNTCCFVNHCFISETCILEVRSTVEEKGRCNSMRRKEKKQEVDHVLPLQFTLQMFQLLQNVKLSLYFPPPSMAFRYTVTVI